MMARVIKNRAENKPQTAPTPALTPTLSLEVRGGKCEAVLTWLLTGLIVLYRVTLGPFLGGQCRFHPTCSQYALDAVRKYGSWRGAWKTLKRLARCHPWGGSGYDPA
jgi:uncharacterized protein